MKQKLPLSLLVGSLLGACGLESVPCAGASKGLLMLLEEGPTAAYESDKPGIDSRSPRGVRWGCLWGPRAQLTLPSLDPNPPSSQGMREMKARPWEHRSLLGGRLQTPAQGQGGPGQSGHSSRQTRQVFSVL